MLKVQGYLAISAPILFQGTVMICQDWCSGTWNALPAHRGALQSVLSMVFGASSPFRTSNCFLFYSERKTERVLLRICVIFDHSSVLYHSPHCLHLPPTTGYSHFSLGPLHCWNVPPPIIFWCLVLLGNTLTHQLCSLPACIIFLFSAYNDLISHMSYPLVYSLSLPTRVNIFFILLSFLLCPQNWEASGRTINIC